MITITSVKHMKDQPYDETWAIVRSMKKPIPGVIHVPELSPSLNLFWKYLSWKKSGAWNADTFQNYYVKQFLTELIQNKDAAYPALNQLCLKDNNGKNICLVCYCPDETLCHRSIIAGLLQGVDCHVQTDTGADYSTYYDAFRKYRNGG